MSWQCIYFKKIKPTVRTSSLSTCHTDTYLNLLNKMIEPCAIEFDISAQHTLMHLIERGAVFYLSSIHLGKEMHK